MRKILIEQPITSSGASTHYGDAVDVANANGLAGDCFSLQVGVTVDTPSAKVFAPADVSTTNNTITITAHGLTEGLKGQFTTVTTLPDGISLATDYFIIVVDANTVKIATSLANAQAGTAVDIIDAGTGDHTFTATALAGASVALQQSNDGVTYFALGSAQNITVTASFLLEKDRPTTRYIRPVFVLTAGHITASSLALVTGEQ